MLQGSGEDDTTGMVTIITGFQLEDPSVFSAPMQVCCSWLAGRSHEINIRLIRKRSLFFMFSAFGSCISQIQLIGWDSRFLEGLLVCRGFVVQSIPGRWEEYLCVCTGCSGQRSFSVKENWAS